MASLPNKFQTISKNKFKKLLIKDKILVESGEYLKSNWNIDFQENAQHKERIITKVSMIFNLIHLIPPC